MNHRPYSVKPRVALTALVAMLAVGCSQPAQKDYDDDGDGKSGGVSSGGGGGGGNSGQAKQLVPINTSLVNKQASLSLLAAATTYDISLAGCATGYTSSADEASTALEVYKFDRGCLGKLDGFEYGGRTYIPTAGDPFTTWIAGDSATFDEALEPGTFALNVKVISQLADPVSGTEDIIYQFSDLTKGADENILAADVGDPHAMTVESAPPLTFTVNSVAFTGVTAGGAGQFVFTLECDTTIGVTDICGLVDMADITYKLVADTYADTLDISEANALFPAGETAVTLPAERVAPGAVPNGGFVTLTLDGPALMASNSNMIFIMQSAGMSYLYFNVDVATLTQD